MQHRNGPPHDARHPMTIDLNPHALALHWTTLFTLIGGGLSLVWLMRRWRIFGLPPQATYGVALKAVFWAMLGARLFHILDYARFYADVPFQMFYLWNGGLSLWGAILVGGAGTLWHARRAGADVRRFADSATFAILATIAFGRLGDFLAGERNGIGTSLPWAVAYGDPRSEAFGLGEMHPVPLYEALLVVALIGGLWRWRGRIGEGLIAPTALLGYSLVRLVLGFVTVQRTHLGLDMAQWVAVAVLAVLGWLWWRGRARRAPAEA